MFDARKVTSLPTRYGVWFSTWRDVTPHLLLLNWLGAVTFC